MNIRFIMRMVMFGLAMVGVIGIVACGQKQTSQNIEDVVLSPDCTFPDAPDVNAPGWVCGEPVDGLEISTVGIAERTSAGISFQRQMAETDARVRLAQQLTIRVQNLIKQYVGVTGSGDQETVDRASSSVTRQITDVKLIGSRFFSGRTSPNGTLYLLMGIDKETTDALLKESMLQSIDNDRAAWQRLLADQADEELVDAIVQQ